MALLPILGRELRSRSRSRTTYWSRFAVALAGTMICISQPASAAGSGGRHVFNAIVGAAFMFCCAACLVAADAISSERRHGTLGLLFLTRARSLDVLLGKVVSVGFLAAWALVASIPVIMVPLSAGGVTVGETVRTAVALFGTMTLALGAGLFAAAWKVARAKIIRYTLVLMAVVVFGPPVLLKITGWWWLGGLLFASPLGAFDLAGEAAYQGAPGAFWQAIAVNQAVALALLLGAGFLLRRTAGLSDVRARPAPVPIAVAERTELTHWEPGKQDSSPVEWLAFRQQGVRAVFWIPTVFLLAFSAWVPVVTGPAGVAGGAAWLRFWPFGLVGALVGGVVIAWMSSRFLFGARNSRELEVLLTTPVCADRLAADQWEAFKRLFLRPVIALQIALLIPALAGGGALAAFFSRAGLFIVPLSLAVTGFTVACLCWVGMWLALKLPTLAAAIGSTVVLTIVGSWLIRFLATVGCVMLANGGAGHPFLFLLPDGCVLIFLVLLLNRARKGVEAELHGLEMPLLPQSVEPALAMPPFPATRSRPQ